MARVLLLEPDRVLAGSLKAYLQHAGHIIAVHTDPQAAVLKADRHPPDVVITELQLAGRSGAEFLYEFRSYPDWHDIPIIIFTNLSEREIQAYADVLTQLKIAACLSKPRTDLEELAGQIARAAHPVRK